MNMLQKNPRDVKHREFHDGEYEYWPVKAPVAGKSISFPAALLNGLGMLAALTAAVLLTTVLTLLYTQTSPRYISHDYAIVNVKVYNNVDNLDVRYNLAATSDPDTILQQGPLEHSEQTLNLQGLTPVTKYFLRYEALKDGVWEFIGDFYFKTLGIASEQTEPSMTMPAEPTEPGTEPAEPPTEPTEPPTEPTEPPTEPTEPPTEPTEPPTEPTEPPTEPTEPPTEPTEPPTEPTEPPTEPTEPPTEPPIEPIVLDSAISDVGFHSSQVSGDENSGYYSFRQTHSFRDIPDGAYDIRIFQNDVEITEYTASIDEEGVLSVTFTGNLIAIGKTSLTTVTVIWEDGTEAVSTQTLVTPSMEEVSLTVTKNADNTHTFTITVTADPNSGYTLAFHTQLFLTYDDYTGVSVEMVETANGVYTGTYTAVINSAEEEEESVVYVSAIWDMAGTPTAEFAPQSGYAYIYYEP